jgi:hypothetical protein
MATPNTATASTSESAAAMFNAPASIAGIDPRKASRVLALNHYGRSGSAFLHSLFDGHPEIISFPSVYMCGFYIFWRDFGHLDPLSLIAQFVLSYPILFDPKVSMAPPGVPSPVRALQVGRERNEPLVIDRSDFSDRLLAKAALVIKDFKRGRLTRKFFFQAIHVAYSEALGQDLEGRDPIILFHAHCPHPATIVPLYEDFSDVRALHCVRDPAQTIGSWYKSLRPIWKDASLPLYVIRSLLENSKPMLTQRCDGYALPGLESMKAACTRTSRAIRLEDLHAKPRATLEALCRWIGIAWDDRLLISTFGGQLMSWHIGGKVYTGHAFQSETTSKKNSDVMSTFDRWRLKFLFGDRYHDWGYENRSGFSSTLLGRLSLALWIVPFRFERLSWNEFESGNCAKLNRRRRLQWFLSTRKAIFRDRLLDWRDRASILEPIRVPES